MKLRTIKGEWVLFDGERQISVTEGSIAFGYVFVMMGVRTIPCTTPALHPVRSLVPHPKKRRLTKRHRELVNKIKANTVACYI